MAVAMPYLSLAMAGYQIYSTESAADKQEDIYKANAERQRMESEESIKRLAFRQEQAESQAKAMAAGSGVKMSGSITDYIDVMAETHKGEIDWLRKSGLSAESIMAREGDLRASMTRQQGRAQAFSSFSRAGTQAGWWE